MLFRNIKKLVAITIMTLVVVFSFLETAYAQTSWKPAGVHEDRQKVMLVDKELRTGFEQINNTVAVHKPSSAAFSSCFSEAAELNAKGSSDLFSNDYSEQVALPINEGLEAIKDSFSFDTIVDYSASVGITVGGSVSLGLKAIGNDKGPTVKGLKCPGSQKKWMEVRGAAVKETPSYSDALKKEFATGVDSQWEDGIDSLSGSISERETLLDEDSRTILLFEGPDVPFASRESMCALLAIVGITGDCSDDEINKK